MASQTNPSAFETFTYATPRPRWWSRPIATFPAGNNGRKPTNKEEFACMSPCYGGILTGFIIFSILLSIDRNVHSHAKFSIQSIALSPDAAATWHVDLLVENPSSKFHVYYDNVDDVSVSLGGQKAAVLNMTHQSLSRDVSTFSLVSLAKQKGDGNDVILGQVDVKLPGIHKRYLSKDAVGYFDVRCHKLTASHEKFICHSTFTNTPMLLYTYLGSDMSRYS